MKKATKEIERAIRNYNTSIKILASERTREHERMAAEACGQLKGMRDMLFLTTGIFVTFEYTEQNYYREISGYNYTITKVN